MRKNPPWTREEETLLLDVYLTYGMVGATHPAVKELSLLLNAMPHQEGAPTYRNPPGVAMKLANLASLDPSHIGAGLTRASRLDRELWDELAGNPAELARLAREIRSKHA
jgi:5-methylcytosine-specific restriction protein A